MITLETPTALLVNRVVSKGDVHLSGSRLTSVFGTVTDSDEPLSASGQHVEMLALIGPSSTSRCRPAPVSSVAAIDGVLCLQTTKIKN